MTEKWWDHPTWWMDSIKIDTCGHVHDHLSAHVSIRLWSPNKWSRIWRSHARALWGPPGGREHYQQIIADLNDGCIFKSNEWIPLCAPMSKLCYGAQPEEWWWGGCKTSTPSHHPRKGLKFDGCKRHLSFCFFGISIQQWIKIGWESKKNESQFMG